MLGAQPELSVLGSPLTPARRERLATINAALYLRRPLLVTGPPGVGKSVLADQIARELGLGRVLRWTVNSRSTLRSGLYDYDPLAQIHDLNLENLHGGTGTPAAPPRCRARCSSAQRRTLPADRSARHRARTVARPAHRRARQRRLRPARYLLDLERGRYVPELPGSARSQIPFRSTPNGP